MENKRYFWLKLKKDFFSDNNKIKKLRKLAGGDTYTIIYLKMMLSTLESGGVITYEGIEPTLAEEIALSIDEEPDNVSVTVNFLLTYGLMIDIGEDRYKFPAVIDNTGSEGSSAKRMRDHRKKKMSLCDKSVTPQLHMRYVETETDLETDLETDIETDIETDKDRESDLLTKIKSVCQSRELSIDPVQIYEQIRQNNTIVKNLEKYLVSVDEYQKAERKQSGQGTKFNENFHQRDYDFENLERQLLSSERGE